MSVAPLRELEVLDPLYTPEHPTEVNLKLLAEFFGVPDNRVASALKINESTFSRNPYARDSSHLKQWQGIFNLIIGIIWAAEPALAAAEVRNKMRRWLNLSRPEFDNKTPLDMMLAGKGRRVRNLLEQMS